MIPVKLTMQGFLTFRQLTQIQFDDFSDEGIFLVSGPTGSGKTSIFDAISFALYGVATTSQRRPEELRSHLISPDDEFFVEFQFRAGAHDYQIARRQKGQRPMKQSLIIDGDEANQLTKVRDIQERIQEVLGLSADQFCKIVMLPQGEFRNFLSASSKEKSDILRKLFDTDHYAQIREMIRLRLGAIRATVDDAEKIIAREKQISEAARESLDPDEIQSILKDELEAAKSDGETSDQTRQLLRAQLDALALKLEEAGRINRDWKLKEELEEAVALAALGEQQALDDQSKADLIAQIRPLMVHHDTLAQNRRFFDSKSLKLRQQGEALKTSRTAFVAAEEDMAKNPARQDELTDLVRETDRIQELFAALTQRQKAAADHVRAEGCAKELSAALTEFRSLTAKKITLTQEKETLTQELMSAGDTTTRLREAYQVKKSQQEEAAAWSARNQSIEAGAAKEMEHCQALDAFAQQMEDTAHRYEALRAEATRQGLAGFTHLLSDGSPCPLCGSLTHPEPFSADPAVTEETLKRAEQSLRRLERQKIEVERDLAHCKADLKRLRAEAQQQAASSDPEVLSADPTILQQQLQEIIEKGQANSAHADALKARIRELDAQRGRLEERLLTMDGIEERAQSARDEETALRLALLALTDKTRDLDEEALLAERDARLSQREALSAQISKAEAAFRLSQQDVTRLEADVASLTVEVEELSVRIAQQEQHLAAQLEALDLSQEEFMDLAKEAELEAVLRRRAGQFLKCLADDRLRLKLVTDALNGRQLTDLETLNAEIEQKKAEEAELAARYAEALKRQSALEQALKKVSEAVAIHHKSSKRLEIARRLDLTTGKGTTFENYVLGYYLEGVLLNANVRLRNMTSGRFTLIRETRDSGGKRSIEGLDLNVFDAYSNSQRDVKTLSGGEGFKASLALALGLSDFIQEKKSGIRLDTVFIDEGFGTLDQESLDSAMETILELQGLGRLVGIISHVEELKERIPTQIVVENRRGDGSVVRVVKH